MLGDAGDVVDGLLHRSLSDMEWLVNAIPTPPTILSVLAIGIAFFTLLNQRRREGTTDARRLREQANQISAWPAVVDGDLHLVLHNGSHLPIWWVRCEPFMVDAYDKAGSPKTRRTVAHAGFETDPIAPGASVHYRLSGEFQGNNVVAELTFVDNQGITWTRYMGELEPSPNAEQPDWARRALKLDASGGKSRWWSRASRG